MLIYSDCGNKSTRLPSAKSIRKSVFEVKTSKRQNKLSKQNKNFLLSLGFKLKKK